MIVIVACIFACVYRVFRGPTPVDRLLAFDLCGVLISVEFALFAIMQDSWAYLDPAMGLAVLAFVGTLSIANYIGRRGVY